MKVRISSFFFLKIHKYFLVAQVTGNSLSSEVPLTFVVENSDSLAYKHTKYFVQLATQANPPTVYLNSPNSYYLGNETFDTDLICT